LKKKSFMIVLKTKMKNQHMCRLKAKMKTKTIVLLLKNTHMRTDPKLHPIEIGAQVEIKSQDGGWFEGTLINTKNDDYTVEYSHLDADKKTKQKKLLECVKKNIVRPKQPVLKNNAKETDLLQEVDAFFNDGWWPRNVVVVRTDNIYGVKISKFEEIQQIPVKALRRGMEWENGEWIQREKVFCFA
ncbi:hypothetical protein EUTSA_v10023057mg, partial [Eutrema salsugineum]